MIPIYIFLLNVPFAMLDHSKRYYIDSITSMFSVLKMHVNETMDLGNYLPKYLLALLASEGLFWDFLQMKAPGTVTA